MSDTPSQNGNDNENNTLGNQSADENEEVEDDAEQDDDIAELYGDGRNYDDDDDEDGENLFGDNMERWIDSTFVKYKLLISLRDYRSQPELDVLSQSGIDDSEFDEISIGARREAEREMAMRDGLQLDDDHVSLSNLNQFIESLKVQNINYIFISPCSCILLYKCQTRWTIQSDRLVLYRNFKISLTIGVRQWRVQKVWIKEVAKCQ